ncbi:MAG: hypothetical protein EGR86_04465 [Ruminiclostridium sp.]|nr:hypothetical protein [Ruminiclostridium sp.]
MRKRFISGLTAVCMLGILLANSFLSVPASAVIAEVGASVAAGLLMGTLFNQMTGGTGYDFTDAFSDCFSFVVTPHNQFIRDNPDADIYLPDGTPYYVDGQYAAAIELKKGEAEIAKMVQSHWNIAESLGLKTPQETIHAAMEAFNAGLADGSIVIHVDDDGNISMPTSSWCTSVVDIYSRLGVYTSKDGANRSRTYWSLVSPYIETTYDSWDVSVCGYKCPYRFAPLFQYVVQNDKLIIFRHNFVAESNGVFYRPVEYYEYPGNVSTGLHPDNLIYSGKYSSLDSFLSNNLSSVSVDDTNSSAVLTLSNLITNDSNSLSITFDSNNNIGFGNVKFDSSQPVQARGFIQIKSDEDSWNNFIVQAQEGAIQSKENNVKIPLTGVENTIGNMGLAGVGAGATKGTVSVDSKTKDITVTNEATKEAELVIEQGNAGDIDIPDSDTIIDKFPFSLPFDLYRLLTIFVAEEKKPIFTVPIQTSFGWSDIEVNVDESFTLDFTQFQIGGVDIVQCLIRTSFYVLFVAFLIKITPKMIQK